MHKSLLCFATAAALLFASTADARCPRTSGNRVIHCMAEASVVGFGQQKVVHEFRANTTRPVTHIIVIEWGLTDTCANEGPPCFEEDGCRWRVEMPSTAPDAELIRFETPEQGARQREFAIPQVDPTPRMFPTYDNSGILMVEKSIIQFTPAGCRVGLDVVYAPNSWMLFRDVR